MSEHQVGRTTDTTINDNAPCEICGKHWDNHTRGPSRFGCPGYAAPDRPTDQQLSGAAEKDDE